MEPIKAYCKAYESGYTKELEEIACKEAYYACWFACDVPEADLNYCLEACKGTEWYAKLQVHIMEEAIG